MDSSVRFHNDEAGQGLVEYMLILAMIALATIAGMKTLATSVNSVFGKMGSVLVRSVS